jgi:hypothetical protein
MILGWKEPLYLAARDEEADRIRGEMEELTGGAGAAKPGHMIAIRMSR